MRQTTVTCAGLFQRALDPRISVVHEERSRMARKVLESRLRSPRLAGVIQKSIDVRSDRETEVCVH